MAERVALLIVDMQEQFRDEIERDLNLGRAIEHIEYMASAFRSASAPVVWVLDCEDVQRDDPGARVVSELAVADVDLMSWKRDSNAFWETDLADRLRELDVGLVVVAGFSVEHCVLFTLHGATERGFRAVLLQHGVLSADAAAVIAAVSQRPVAGYPVLEFLLQAGK